jgi:hypothetical protein
MGPHWLKQGIIVCQQTCNIKRMGDTCRYIGDENGTVSVLQREDNGQQATQVA